MLKQGNRGLASEQLLEIACNYYRSCGNALLHKVPTEWKPLRRYCPQTGKSEIVSAKVQKKAIVDFLGIWRSVGVAFDVKEYSSDRWKLERLAEHQRLFLEEFRSCGGITFILLVHTASGTVHLLPFDEYERRFQAYLQKTGRASIKLDEIKMLPLCEEIPGCPCDFLLAWQQATATGLASDPLIAWQDERLSVQSKAI
jgi:recombination protein U